MRTQNSLFRASAAAAIGGLVLGPTLAPLALAQDAASATATASASTGAASTGAGEPGDPPARVGRVSGLTGTVSFHTSDEDHWVPATLNYPVTSGNSFWTQPQSAATIEVGATHLAMCEQTELDIGTLDYQTLTATEPQGELYLRVPQVLEGESYSITTPRGVVKIDGPGRFDIVAGDTQAATTLTVIDGTAQITGPSVDLTVNAHQTATITGTDTFQGSIGAETDTTCLNGLLAQEQPTAQAPSNGTATATVTASASATATAYAPPPEVQEMTGAADLQTQGQWVDSTEYGHVWYPPEQTNWVPYRDGHWAYVAPWGWTWIDNARWGFAPFHYGRWVEYNNRWGWTPLAPGAAYVGGPAIYARPVYAPALVSFIGLGVGVAAGLALAGAFNGNIGWAPLGYRQPYFPPYYVSRGYLGRINQFAVPRATITNINTNYTRIYNNNSVHTTVINNYYGGANARVNQRAATFVPARAMVQSQPVSAHVVHVSSQQLAQARPLGAAPVVPTAQTAGVTRPVLQRVNPAAAKAAPAALARPAPGPAIAAAPARPAGNGAPPRPPLAAPAGSPARPTAGAPAGSPARPAAVTPPPAAAHPASGLPALHGPTSGNPGGETKPGAAPGPAITHPPAANQPAAATHPATPQGATPQTATHAEAPHAAPPRVETPRVETPRVETPRVETPHAPAAHAPAPVPHPVAHEAAPHPTIHTAPAPRPVPHPAPRVEPHPAPRVESHPAPGVEPRVEPRPAPRPEPRPAPRPEPRPEPRPAPHPEPRPAPHRACPPGHPAC